MRRGTYKWRPRNECLSEARVERGKYRCAGCGEIVGRKEIQIDHIIPCVDPTKGWQGFDSFLDRMFCEKEGFQALCKDKCHQAKSIQEKKIGAERRAREKKSAKKKRKI